nr:9080_t:CDS:2 [Entrophospora candida]
MKHAEDAFISTNPNAEYELERDEEEIEESHELKDSNQLESFEGKFINPREPKIRDTIIQSSNHISKTLDIRLKELEKSSSDILTEMKAFNDVFNKSFVDSIEQITGLLSEIGGNMK